MNFDNKTYNRYIKTAKLACDNVRAAICTANRLSDKSIVQVRVSDKQRLAECVADVMRDPSNGKIRCETAIHDILRVSTTSPLPKSVKNWDKIFVDSVVRSRNARVCQKYLVDLLSAEMYFKDAYEYDKSRPYGKAVPAAKDVITQMYSRDFLKNFDFSAEPCVSKAIRTSLEKQVFDVRYSVADSSTNELIVKKQYAKVFGSRQDFFIVKPMTRVSAKAETRKNTMPAVKQTKADIDAMLINELYKTSSATILSQNKIRRFVNLQLRNKDIFVCPVRSLPAKRQYAVVDAMTKHEYIRSYYEDEFAKLPWRERSNKFDYYFEQELYMYRYMWGDDTLNIEIGSGFLSFSDGRRMSIPAGFMPYEFLHEINITYGAMFGFGPADVHGGKNWLYDSIRQAYTDEGMAEYRLALIDKRMSKKKGGST